VWFSLNFGPQPTEKDEDVGAVRRFESVLKGRFLVPERFLNESTFCRRLVVVLEATFWPVSIVPIQTGKARKCPQKSFLPKRRKAWWWSRLQ
jgi:hypothetical protein